jgi:PAS domain S-box-containing protein
MATSQQQAEIAGEPGVLTSLRERATKLERSERRFREIIDALPAAIYTTDFDGYLTHFNPAAVALAGRVPELGKDRWCVSWKLYRPDGTVLPSDECLMAVALKEGRDVRGAEAIIERPNGERVWLEPYPTLLRDATGKLTGGVNMLVDITERKRVAQALLSSQQRLQTTIEAGKFGQWQRDRDGLEIVLSPQCKAHFGLAPDAPFTADTLRRSMHPDDFGRVMRAVERAFNESGDYEIDYRCIWPNGEVQWINSRGRVIGDGPSARLFGLTSDIAGRKRTEAWLDGQKRVLEMLATRAPLADVLGTLIRALEAQAEDLLGSILIRGGDGNQFETGIGPTLPESYMQAFHNVPILPPYLGPCGMAANRGEMVMVPDIAGDERWAAEWRELALRHGLRACFSIPIFGSNGATLGSFGIYRRAPRGLEMIDPQLLRTAAHLAGIAIESNQAEQQLRQSEAGALNAAERLRRANFELQQFAYSASHDLQEPLRNVAVYSEMVNRRYSAALDADGKEFLGFITSGARRLEMLIKDLLAYTRTASAPDDENETASAAQALESAVSNLTEAIRESGAEITCDSLPEVRVREVELRQLFQNLIGNGIKYHRQEEAPRIHISAERADGFGRVTVRDNGIGIAPEYRETVFGMFKRLHTDGEYPGTGMGLAICQKIVERHGGHIQVESEPDKGSTFTFTLPGVEAQ